MNRIHVTLMRSCWVQLPSYPMTSHETGMIRSILDQPNPFRIDEELLGPVTSDHSLASTTPTLPSSPTGEGTGMMRSILDQPHPFKIDEELLGPPMSDHSLTSSTPTPPSSPSGSQSKRTSSSNRTASTPPNSRRESPTRLASSSNRTASSPINSPKGSPSRPLINYPASSPLSSPRGSPSRPASPSNCTASSPTTSHVGSASKPASPSNQTASSSTTSNVGSASKPASPSDRTASSPTTSHVGSPFRPSSSINHHASSPPSSPRGPPSRFAPSSSRATSSDSTIWGNICPRGVDPKMGTGFKSPPKTKVLGSGNSYYGYGSIINTRNDGHKAVQSGDWQFNKGRYTEALQDYDRAVRMNPGNVSYRISRADTLVQLGRFEEALTEYGEAKICDPSNGTLHHRLSLFHLRLGVVDLAEMHISLADPKFERELSEKLEKLKDHLVKGANARRDGNWKAALREVDSMIADGIDSSKPILAFRAEMLLRLDVIDQAKSAISKALELEPKLPTLLRFLSMDPEAYVCAVHAQIEMALGRFENAVAAADRARRIDKSNDEISAIQSNVRLTSQAHIKGNRLYKSGDYLAARHEYEGGLRYAPSNAALLCNVAACYWNMGRWLKCIGICNKVLEIQPNYAKALLRRADSLAKLEKWAESVRDYRVLVNIFPRDAKFAEALSRAEVVLKESHGEDVSNTEIEAEVKEITTEEHLQEAISIPGTSIVFFTEQSSAECIAISGCVDSLCALFPSSNFIKVDIGKCRSIARAACVRIVPTFKIYKNGNMVKEMTWPRQKTLETWIRHYCMSN